MIIHTRLESPQLAGNLLGDPSERDLFVYLPPGYEDSDRRYPTAYLLHAYGGTAERVGHASDRRGTMGATARRRPRSRVPAYGRAAHDRRDPRRLVAVGVWPMGGFARDRPFRAVCAP